MRPSMTAAIFIFSVAFGLWINDRSWNGQVYVYIGEDRAPAAVRALDDYSSLDRKALFESVHTQLLANAEILQDSGKIGLRLGHPLVNREGGGKEFGCRVLEHTGAYDRIEMIFMGNGVSEGGESPRMIVNSPCHSESSLSELDTVWIPMADLVHAGARDQVFTGSGEHPLKIQLQSVVGHWPDSWVLYKVRLYREESPDHSLVIDAKEMRQARGQLLSFPWKSQ